MLRMTLQTRSWRRRYYSSAIGAAVQTYFAGPNKLVSLTLLVSTMIPSLVNLVIGGASLLRGVPGVPLLLLLKLPVARAVPAFDRAWIATVLTLQTVGGAILGIAAQVLLAVGIIGYVMPFFGLELLDMARDVAVFNVPARVGQLFGVSL